MFSSLVLGSESLVTKDTSRERSFYSTFIFIFSLDSDYLENASRLGFRGSALKFEGSDLDDLVCELKLNRLLRRNEMELKLQD